MGWLMLGLAWYIYLYTNVWPRISVVTYALVCLIIFRLVSFLKSSQFLFRWIIFVNFKQTLFDVYKLKAIHRYTILLLVYKSALEVAKVLYRISQYCDFVIYPWEIYSQCYEAVIMSFVIFIWWSMFFIDIIKIN